MDRYPENLQDVQSEFGDHVNNASNLLKSLHHILDKCVLYEHPLKMSLLPDGFPLGYIHVHHGCIHICQVGATDTCRRVVGVVVDGGGECDRLSLTWRDRLKCLGRMRVAEQMKM